MDLKYPPGLSKYCKRMNLLSFKEIGNDLSLKLSNDQAGRLIGNGGKTIKGIRKRFDGVKIDINNFGQRVVKISGRDKVRVYGLILTQIL